ncbi:MAG: GDSL-type esterase/lipase family protein, partial [Pseudomonadales bacterium]|nr:GDSL-type esterase/lipase family protein [Pseudomonadales bacterium]
FKYQPKLIVLYIGINDILYRDYQRTNELSQDLFKLTDQIQHKMPTTDLVLLAVRPLEGPDFSRAVDHYNQQLESYASHHGNVHYINANSVLLTVNNIPNPDLIMWDGLHLNKAGYHAWGNAIRNKLNNLDLL